MHKKHVELQTTNCSPNSDPAAPTQTIAPNTNKRKRRRQPTPRLHGMDPIRILFLKGLLDTYADEQYTSAIQKLPEA